jgi:hypothetical protein
MYNIIGVFVNETNDTKSNVFFLLLLLCLFEEDILGTYGRENKERWKVKKREPRNHFSFNRRNNSFVTQRDLMGRTQIAFGTRLNTVFIVEAETDVSCL